MLQVLGRKVIQHQFASKITFQDYKVFLVPPRFYRDEKALQTKTRFDCSRMYMFSFDFTWKYVIFLLTQRVKFSDAIKGVEIILHWLDFKDCALMTII